MSAKGSEFEPLKWASVGVCAGEFGRRGEGDEGLQSEAACGRRAGSVGGGVRHCRHVCRRHLYSHSPCKLTLPMKDLWLAVYIADAILVFFVIPFAIFYYEGD